MPFKLNNPRCVGAILEGKPVHKEVRPTTQSITTGLIEVVPGIAFQLEVKVCEACYWQIMTSKGINTLETDIITTTRRPEEDSRKIWNRFDENEETDPDAKVTYDEHRYPEDES